jgi:hypothetical protein
MGTQIGERELEREKEKLIQSFITTVRCHTRTPQATDQLSLHSCAVSGEPGGHAVG